MQKHIESVASNVLKTKDGRPVLSSKSAVCCGKRSRFMKEQEAKVLLSSLGLKTPLNKSCA